MIEGNKEGANARKKVLIIGGVAGGASCAARLRRLDEHASIKLVERGPYISYANCGLPYHLGGVIPNREDLLVQKADDFEQRFNVEVLTLTEAVSIDREKRTVRLVKRTEGAAAGGNGEREGEGETWDEHYDYLVLSPGAEPMRPPFPGVDSPGVMTLRSIPDLDRIISRIQDGNVKNAVVAGAGFIGLEAAENLRHRGISVTLVELMDGVMPGLDREMTAQLESELILHKVDVKTGCGIRKIEAMDNGRLKVFLTKQDGEPVEAGIVILATGVRPETKLASDSGLEVGSTGGIAVDEKLRTSDKRILAVGDAIEVKHRVTGRACRIPLAGPANRQGRMAADVISGRDVSYKGALGTSIVKVFRLTAGAAGLTETQAAKAGVKFKAMWVHGASHAGYYPGASPLSLKALFDPESGRLLGAQAIGQEGVDKRLDILACAISAGLTVFDLEEMDFAYAPPFSSAKDPVNHLGSAAANMLRGDHPGVRADELENLIAAGGMLLDVRSEDEFACGTIPGAVNIPLSDMRSRMGELPEKKRIIVFCQVGIRGYIATRILSAAGFDSANVLGGYGTWAMFNRKQGGLTEPEQTLDPASGPSIGTDDMMHFSCKRDGGAVSADETSRDGKDKDSISLMVTPIKVDACGLACPGPILKVKQAMDELEEGGVIEVTATDPGFMADLPAWARRSGGEVLSLDVDGSKTKAMVRKRKKEVVPVEPVRLEYETRATNGIQRNGQTIVVFSGDLDKGLAAMIIATGAAAMGKDVTLFFTFWGLNFLRKSSPPKVRKTFMEKMFGWMMPRGAAKARLSKMNMAGAGTGMMRKVMKAKNVASLSEMLDTARSMKIRLVACGMSMDVMGIHREELIDGVETGGVAAYLDYVEDAHHNLFI